MMKDVKITCPGPSGIGTKIEIEGRPIGPITHVTVDIPLEDASTVTITRYLSALEVSGNFEVDELIIIPDRPGKKYRLVEVEE